MSTRQKTRGKKTAAKTTETSFELRGQISELKAVFGDVAVYANDDASAEDSHRYITVMLNPDDESRAVLGASNHYDRIEQFLRDTVAVTVPPSDASMQFYVPANGITTALGVVQSGSEVTLTYRHTDHSLTIKSTDGQKTTLGGIRFNADDIENDDRTPLDRFVLSQTNEETAYVGFEPADFWSTVGTAASTAGLDNDITSGIYIAFLAEGEDGNSHEGPVARVVSSDRGTRSGTDTCPVAYMEGEELPPVVLATHASLVKGGRAFTDLASTLVITQGVDDPDSVYFLALDEDDELLARTKILLFDADASSYPFAAILNKINTLQANADVRFSCDQSELVRLIDSAKVIGSLDASLDGPVTVALRLRNGQVQISTGGDGDNRTEASIAYKKLADFADDETVEVNIVPDYCLDLLRGHQDSVTASDDEDHDEDEDGRIRIGFARGTDSAGNEVFTNIVLDRTPVEGVENEGDYAVSFILV